MAKQQQTTTKVRRPPINRMSDEQLAAWIEATRTALVQKMQRERAYLDRRAARGNHTPTDDAYEHDGRLEADLLSLLDEMAANLGLEGRNA
jgi:hypothetical protein